MPKCSVYESFKGSISSNCNGNCRNWCAPALSSACSAYITQKFVMVTATVHYTIVITPSCVPVTVTDTQYYTSPAVTITPSCTTITVTNIHTKSYAPPLITISSSCPVYPSPTSAKCPTVTFPQPPVLPTCITTNTSAAAAATVDGVDSTRLAVLGSFTVLLALLLVVTITGWIYTAAFVRRKKDKTANIRYVAIHMHASINVLALHSKFYKTQLSFNCTHIFLMFNRTYNIHTHALLNVYNNPSPPF